MTGKCLIVDTMHDSLFPMLKEIGWEYDYRPNITKSEVQREHQGYDGLIVRSKVIVNRDLLGDSPTVKFIGRAGAGLDNLDLDYLEEKKIAVLHAAEGNKDAVGEFAIGSLLALMRNIPRADAEVRKFVWEREANRGEEIMDKTIGIIGYGNMGQSFARRLSGFGCKVLAFDKYKAAYGDSYAEEASMETIYEQTDILSLHIPLTHETRFMVNESFLHRFEKKIILVNTARGEIVSLVDLEKALNTGKVRGAALDVLENEKLQQLTVEQQQTLNMLSRRTNVIFTPHIAGWTFESHIKINVALVNKIKALDVN